MGLCPNVIPRAFKTITNISFDEVRLRQTRFRQRFTVPARVAESGEETGRWHFASELSELSTRCVCVALPGRTPLSVHSKVSFPVRGRKPGGTAGELPSQFSRIGVFLSVHGAGVSFFSPWAMNFIVSNTKGNTKHHEHERKSRTNQKRCSLCHRR